MWERGSNAVAVCLGDATLTHQAKDAKGAEDLFDDPREKLPWLRALPVDPQKEQEFRIKYTAKPVIES
jgi:hypothetical protein